MTHKPPLFVELCAGTAALSLRLAHPRARPPVSRMGAKTGYADAILRCMGLHPGQGAEHYLWCEPDAGVRLLLHALRDREIATKAAAIIASWKDEDPRALWERLKAEGPAVCPPVDPREVARWIQRAVWSYEQGNVKTGFVGPGDRRQDTTATATATATARIALGLPATIAEDARKIDPREVARVARIISANRLVNPDPETWQNTGNGGYKHGGAEFCTPIGRLADAMAAVPQVDGAAVVDDAREVDLREVARWAWIQRRTVNPGGYFRVPARDSTATAHGGPEYSPVAPSVEIESAPTLPATLTDDARAVNPREVARWSWIAGHVDQHGINLKPQYDPDYVGPWDSCAPSEWLRARLDALPAVDATITDDARPVEPPQLPPGVIAYIDPPYRGTTGYSHKFPRSEWLPVVRRWRDAGALVVVSEAEPIPDLMAEGWHAVEITGERKGQKRTFSKQQREFLTMSKPPQWRPAVQQSLFS